MRLILDTNILFKGGRFLGRGEWPVLISAARMGYVRICVPEVVIREHVNRYSNDLTMVLRDLKKGEEMLAALRPPVESDPESEALVRHSWPQSVNAEAWTGSYDAWLRGFIHEHGAVLPLPTISHDKLLDAVLERRKPFAAGEKGYRDALIWWTVVEAIDDERTMFATDNAKDFMDGDGTSLADDLVADLGARSEHLSTLSVRRTLAQVLDELVPSSTPAEDQFRALVASTEGSALLTTLVYSAGRAPLHDPSGHMPEWPEWIEVGGDFNDPVIKRVQVRPLDGRLFIVSATVVGYSHVDCGIEESELAEVEEGWTMWDDWGDGYTLAYRRPQRISYEITARFEPPNLVTMLEIDRATLLGPWLP